jgi:hypothetical protein
MSSVKYKLKSSFRRPISKNKTFRRPISKSKTFLRPISKSKTFRRPISKTKTFRRPTSKSKTFRRTISKSKTFRGPMSKSPFRRLISKSKTFRKPISKSKTFRRPISKSKTFRRPISKSKTFRRPLNKTRFVDWSTKHNFWRPINKNTTFRRLINKNVTFRKPVLSPKFVFLFLKQEVVKIHKLNHSKEFFDDFHASKYLILSNWARNAAMQNLFWEGDRRTGRQQYSTSQAFIIFRCLGRSTSRNRQILSTLSLSSILMYPSYLALGFTNDIFLSPSPITISYTFIIHEHRNESNWMTPEITKLINIFWSTARSKADVYYFLYGDKMIASSWTAKLKEQPLALHECSFKTYLPSLSVDRVLYDVLAICECSKSWHEKT